MRCAIASVVVLQSLLPCLQYDALAQVAATLGGQVAPREFTRTSDGNWRTIIPAIDGAPARQFVYVPPTKIELIVRASVELENVAGRPVFRYRYLVANGQGGRQELARLFIGTGHVVEVERIPSSWRYMQPQRVGNVSLAGPMVNGALSGLAPGERAAEIELSGRVLPGLITVRAAGNTSGAIEVPEGLTETQYRELSELSRQATVDIPAIGPAIPAGVSEPELEFGVLASRVKLHYSAVLRRYGHPRAEELISLLDRTAREDAQASDAAVAAALQRIIAVSSEPVADSFQSQLGTALATCARALLTGVAPFRL